MTSWKLALYAFSCCKVQDGKQENFAVWVVLGTVLLHCILFLWLTQMGSSKYRHRPQTTSFFQACCLETLLCFLLWFLVLLYRQKVILRSASHHLSWFLHYRQTAVSNFKLCNLVLQFFCQEIRMKNCLEFKKNWWYQVLTALACRRDSNCFWAVEFRNCL